MRADGVRHKRARRWHIEIPATTGETSNTVNVIDRIRRRRQINRQHRAIDRALQSAPTQAVRDEIAFFAQRQPF
jgi:hypothetical protein